MKLLEIREVEVRRQLNSSDTEVLSEKERKRASYMDALKKAADMKEPIYLENRSKLITVSEDDKPAADVK